MSAKCSLRKIWVLGCRSGMTANEKYCRWWENWKTSARPPKFIIYSKIKNLFWCSKEFLQSEPKRINDLLPIAPTSSRHNAKPIVLAAVLCLWKFWQTSLFKMFFCFCKFFRKQNNIVVLVKFRVNNNSWNFSFIRFYCCFHNSNLLVFLRKANAW